MNLVLLATFALAVQASVVGIDLGSQFFKAHLVKPGSPFTIVENTASHRKTPTGITFTKEERLYGLDSIIQGGSNAEKSFMFSWDLIGLPFSEELI